jgi:thioredoxin reductase (NADPH)
MIVREKEISPKVKYWVRPDLINRIEEGSIKAYFNAKLIEIDTNQVRIQSGDETPFEIKNDYVLAMTGYEPDFKLIRSLGVAISDEKTKAPVYDEATMETNQSGVFVAGVVCGGLETNKWFIENSRVHAQRIVNHLAKK